MRLSSNVPRAVIVTPNENDAQVALSFLSEAGIAARACASLAALCKLALDEVGCAVLVEEALVHPEVDEFLALVAAQPPWSDLPLVLIASQGAALGALVERVFPQSGNVAVLERPMNPVSLVSAVRVGLRARDRQLQVRELLDQRARALRMREEFLAMLGHELRNPLAPMRNSVYVMKRLEIDDPRFVATRDMIDRQVTHMARLVDDLLDVSRLELGKVHLQMRELDLNAAVTAATEANLPMISARRHTLEVRLAPEPLWVLADPVRIEQIIGNLVTNAAKFTPEGGRIVVESTGDAERASIHVRDTGMGIPSEMLGAVFELFAQDEATLERSAGGLGIGLTVVKRLVELHDGTISVASEGRGRGAQFSVHFPRQKTRTATIAPAAGREASLSRRSVLVVEDNADVRESLGLLLTMWGHGVHFADSGLEAVERASRVQPEIALIDIGLPGLNGYDVARAIRESRHRLGARDEARRADRLRARRRPRRSHRVRLRLPSGEARRSGGARPSAEVGLKSVDMSSKLQGRTARGAAEADLACMYMGSTLLTPLYVLYEEEFGFSELMLTIIFSAYAMGNIAALFIFGRISDQIGRRRTALPALGVAALSTIVFLFATGTGWLFAGRLLSGLAIGMSSAAATAWVVDLTRDRKEQRGAAFTTASIFFGLAIAALLAGTLAQYAPAPLKLPFIVYLVLLAVMAFFVARTKETVEDPAESVDEVSLKPRIGIPREIRGAFVSPAMTAFAVFAVTAFYAALAPSVLRRDMDISNLAIGGAVVFELFVFAAITAAATSALKSRTGMLSGAALLVPGVGLLVLAQALQSFAILLAGVAVTGIAAALGYRGSLQVINEIAPEERRAEVISSFAIVCFIGNGVPVIGVGVLSSAFSPPFATASLAVVTSLLAVIALATELVRNRKREAGAPA